MQLSEDTDKHFEDELQKTGHVIKNIWQTKKHRSKARVWQTDTCTQ